jgi:hypothetical protein
MGYVRPRALNAARVDGFWLRDQCGSAHERITMGNASALARRICSAETSRRNGGQVERAPARRTLCDGKQRRDAVVEDAVVRDRRDEAVSPRWRTILEIAQALVVTRNARRRFRVDRDPLAELDERVTPTAR